MSRTKIEYLTHSWNPLAMRCTPVSEGCAHCWHLRMADRLAANPALPAEVREAYAGRSAPVLVLSRLGEPDSLKEPAVIGVQFMGDLFHPDVHDLYRRDVFLQIGACPQHTFLILTKRPVEMQRYVQALVREGDFFADHWWGPNRKNWRLFPNLWLGVSVENQQRADERIPALLQTPAAVRFISAEPLLAPVDLERYLWLSSGSTCGPWTDWSGKHRPGPRSSGVGGQTVSRIASGDIGLVICGAETGPGKRPMELDWARQLRDDCVAAGVPFFFKKDSDGNHELDGQVWEQTPVTATEGAK